MAGLVEPVMSKEEIKVRVVWPNGWWLFAVISRSDHHFYDAAFGICGLFIASGFVSDDPVLREMGSAIYFSGHRHLSLGSAFSKPFYALVTAKSALHRPVLCCRDGLAGRLHFYCVLLPLGTLLRRDLPTS